MVYVDALIPCRPNRRWHWFESAHMFADSLEELHRFARTIGLRRCWFQNHHRVKHYDLTRGKWRVAVRAGAIELSREQAVKKWEELRRTQYPENNQLTLL